MTDENKKMLLEAGIDFDGIATRIPLKEDFLLKMLRKYPNEKSLKKQWAPRTTRMLSGMPTI